MKNKKLLMIPGPSPVVRPILDELGRETIAFGDPVFVQDFRDLLADLKTLWPTAGEVFVVAGTGTLAMEMAAANALRPGDAVLVVSHGYFGDRFAEICRRRGCDVVVLAAEWGTIVSPERVQEELKKRSFAAVTITHVDTSTGVSAPVQELAGIIRSYEKTLCIVDGVCATAGEPEMVDEWGVDVLLTGSQKAFGVPPGLALLWAGPKAIARRRELGTIRDYYMDYDMWTPIMHEPSKYFATPAVNMVWALKEAVRLIKAEGLAQRIERHARFGRSMQAAFERLGFGILAASGHRAATLSAVLYPAGINDASFRSILAEEGVQVSGGLGAYAGKLFRMGHMGNIDEHDLVASIAAVERTLLRCGVAVESGSGVNALSEGLTKKGSLA